MVGGGPLLTITGCKGCLVVEDCGVIVLESEFLVADRVDWRYFSYDEMLLQWIENTWLVCDVV